MGCGTKKAVEKNKNFKFSLNHNAGYNWSYKVSKSDIIDISITYDNLGCNPEVVDRCVEQDIYTIKALKSSKVTLILEQSFIEPDDKHLSETAIYEITVNDDLSITETHYGTYFYEG